MENQDGTLVDGKAAETALHLISCDGRRLRSGRDGLIERRDAQFDDFAAAVVPRLLVTGSDHQAMQPRIYPLRLTESTDVAPC